MSLDERFQAAVTIVQKLPKDGPVQTSNEQKLKFYSLFKQATIGDVNTERPGFFSIVEKAKWDAWKSLEGTSSDEAKEKYVEALLEMFDEIGSQVNVGDWLNGSELDPVIKTNLELLGVKAN
ncbi:acyl coA binding protein domain-containing protein [Ditylenchus destructor]|uniref:Acyl coA binding protein domain-containing protein n=1 Tax=Ditylenchus destructor TaxID=166010 RepID=A0AAD4N8Q5_9BILA|nr:acyl coA binding protein domain-containing protein [Ditylenchus destructor]